MATAKRPAQKKSAAPKKASSIRSVKSKGTTATAGKRNTKAATPVRKIKKAAATPSSAGTPDTQPTVADTKRLAHGLRALLHTMQTVQRFEESLCSMMHAIERKRPRATLLRELHKTLENLPVNDYRDDVEDLLHALG